MPKWLLCQGLHLFGADSIFTVSLQTVIVMFLLMWLLFQMVKFVNEPQI